MKTVKSKTQKVSKRKDVLCRTENALKMKSMYNKKKIFLTPEGLDRVEKIIWSDQR